MNQKRMKIKVKENENSPSEWSSTGSALLCIKLARKCQQCSSYLIYRQLFDLCLSKITQICVNTVQAEAPKIFGAQDFAPGASKRWSGAASLIVMQARNMNRLSI